MAQVRSVALASRVQKNNVLLAEFSKGKPENLEDVVDNFKLLIKSVDFDLLILGSTGRRLWPQTEVFTWIASDCEECQPDDDRFLVYIIPGTGSGKHGDYRDLCRHLSEESVEDGHEKDVVI